MPKIVDPDARRDQIAAALFRVAAERGLEAVSLRQVAAEAGVSAGMVQHYFHTKDEMMEFAIASVADDIASHLPTTGVDGAMPSSRRFLRMLLERLLPVDEQRARQATVTLAFTVYSLVRSGNSWYRLHSQQMREFVEAALRAEQEAGTSPSAVEPAHAAAALVALVDGLVTQVLRGGCSVELARASFEAALDDYLGPEEQSGPED